MRNSFGARSWSIAATLAIAAPVHGQCEGWVYSRAQRQPGADQVVYALCRWHAPGQNFPSLIAGGSFQRVCGESTRRVARLDVGDERWQGFEQDFSWVTTATQWDADGEGPAKPLLVVGGTFSSLDRITWWDPEYNGGWWRPFADGMNGDVLAVISWDPDGHGPQRPILVAGGGFDRADNKPIRNIARWDPDAQTWEPMGQIGGVLALTTWDADGDGPQPPQLIAGGDFNKASDEFVYYMARWDPQSSAWVGMGGGMDSFVHALTEWDPDGAGPAPSVVVAGGRFITSSGATTNRIAYWNGDGVWHPLGSGMDNEVRALTTWQLGASSDRRSLIAGGWFTAAGGDPARRVARWEGDLATGDWRPVGDGAGSDVLAFTTWDADGDGPEGESLVAGGYFHVAGDAHAPYIASCKFMAGEFQWAAFAGGVPGSVYALASPEPSDVTTGSGRDVLVGGTFAGPTGVAGRRIAALELGEPPEWHPLGGGVDDTVLAIAAWHPNHGSEAQIVIGGSFLNAEGSAASRVARWNGSAWQALGEGMSGTVNALVDWDPGDGNPSRLVAGGSFTTADGNPALRVAQWDGSAWLPMGQGMNSAVWDLATWDPDGAGPLPKSLVAVGAFTQAGGQEANRVARWNGVDWEPIGLGANGLVAAVTSWDADGPGPQTPALVIGGFFQAAGGHLVNRIARWNGSDWEAFMEGINGSVNALASLDPDGTGPLLPQLVAGGTFSVAGQSSATNIARWIPDAAGGSWHPLATGVLGTVRALTAWNPHPTNQGPAELLVGGDFTTVDGRACWYLGRWSHSGVPPLSRHPEDQWVTLASNVVLAVSPAPGYDTQSPLQFSWQRNGVPISDGPGGASVGGGFVSGASAKTLVISGFTVSDFGAFDCVVSNACGASTSAVAILSRQCVADFDTSGFVDTDDFDSFIRAFEAGGDDADIDGSGFVDTDDFDAFVVAFEAGC